ncbi:MAG: 3-oxoacyl-[acyl-carrier-protein] reductase [Desulfobacterales bacterium]|nr:3-oxoacyl-[acyl-carrier-protein] reductase [Desulfobacterales bacterium]
MGEERTVIVTGGARGIGQTICLALAGPGTRIYYNDVLENADETAKRVAEAGGTAAYVRADVTSGKEVKALFDQVLQETGRVDVLVNNAGVTRDGWLVRMKEKDWDLVMEINLKGAFNCMKLAGKQMMKQRAGRIISISSVVGASGNPGQANYSASKAGLVGLTKTAAYELAGRGVTVNAVAPGYIETEMTAALSEKAQEALLSRVPLQRPGQPEEVAAAVAFLASENAAYITGQVIHVNGGMYM